MILNNNHATTQLKHALKPIKKAIPAYFKEDVLAEAGVWHIPTHKIVMRVTDEFETYNDEDEYEPTADEQLIESMKRNPYVAFAFTKLSHTAPETVNVETVSEFITHLYDHGFVPDDVQVALSPYNLSSRTAAGTLTVVAVFDVEVYGTEETQQGTPKRVDPRDYLTV